MSDNILTRGALDRRVTRPGKFQGELQATEQIYNAINAGYSHDSVGSVSENGVWTALVINIPYGRKLVSAIVQETEQGFVYARYYDDSIIAEKAFNAIAAQVEGSDSYNENPAKRDRMAGYIGEMDRQGRTFRPTVSSGKLTLARAQQLAKEYGFTIKSRDGEYSVTAIGERAGDRTYYTDDLEDALGTARNMSVGFGAVHRGKGRMGGR